MALKSKIVDLIDSNKATLHGLVVRQLRENSGERAKVPSTRESVNTKSNLNFATLAEILYSIGCDFKRYEEYAEVIDEQLVAVRNRIAHGEEEYIHLTEWDEIREIVFDIMDNIADQIVVSADQKMYLAWRA